MSVKDSFTYNRILILFVIVFFFTILINCSISLACLPLDARFSLVIGNLDIDYDRLKEICTDNTCKFIDNEVVLKSSFDSNVAVIVSPGNDFIKNMIIIKLPYEIIDYEIRESGINPEEFDWKNCVKRDLEVLASADIIKIDENSIKIISSLAENNNNILYCSGRWKKIGANCNCYSCVKCIGKASPISLPEDTIKVIGKEENRDTRFIFFIIFLVVILSLIVSILLFLSRTPYY